MNQKARAVEQARLYESETSLEIAMDPADKPSIASPPSKTERVLLLALVVGARIYSGIAPKDRMAWLLEMV